MWSSTWLVRGAALASLLIGTAPLLAQNKAPATTSVPAGQNGSNAQFIAQLKIQFKKADLDQDEYLDKDELAKAFRGPKATAPAQGMYDDEGHLTKTYYDASKKYPDLVLLWAADTDADDRLSWTEYQTYQLKLLANQQQQQQALLRATQSANRSLATGSRRNGNRSYSNYGNRRNSSAYSSASRNNSYLQRSLQNQQRQMVRAAQYWQQMQIQAMINYQRMYQQVMQQRLQMQRTMAQNYTRQQQTASHRVVQRHQNPATRPATHPAKRPTPKKR